MKAIVLAVRRDAKMAVFILLLGLFAGTETSHAQRYQVGQIVTNFTVYTRRAWTNSAEKPFAPGTPIQLSDFAGKILFVQFFDPT